MPCSVPAATGDPAARKEVEQLKQESADNKKSLDENIVATDGGDGVSMRVDVPTPTVRPAFFAADQVFHERLRPTFADDQVRQHVPGAR